LVLASAVLLIAPIGRAQTSVIRMNLPLVSFSGGDRSMIRVTVTELTPGTSSRVRIRLLDEAEHQLPGGTAEGDLRLGTPGRLDYRLAAIAPGRIIQARAQVDIDRGAGAKPVVVVEHVHHAVDPIDNRITTRIVCGPPGKIGDPVSLSDDDGITDGLIATGCRATWLTSGF
jgi:hypothetical protein